MMLGADEDAAGEIAAPGHKVDALPVAIGNGRETVLQMMQGLVDLSQMLVRKGFIGLDIIGPPAEMGGGRE